MIQFLIVSVKVLSRNLDHLDFKTTDIVHYLNSSLDNTEYYLIEIYTSNKNLWGRKADSTSNMVGEKMCLYQGGRQFLHLSLIPENVL